MKAEIPKTLSNCHRQVAWLILILLLLLRIPYVIAIIYFLPIENQSGAAVYEIGTYFLIAVLIWWERDRLADFHIDLSALALIVLFRPMQTLILGYWKVESPLAFPSPFGLLIWAISIGLVISLWRSGFKPARFSSSTLGWLAVGLFAGLCVSVAENLGSFLSIIRDSAGPPSVPASVLVSTSLNLLYHLGFAPINEEPLFRGFLWGYLRGLNWKEGRILLFQAALFTSAHVYYAMRYPFMFWVLIPVSALLFGVLTMRSRSISPAILAHGLINGSVYLLASGLISIIV
jgi:hypothetical protein